MMNDKSINIFTDQEVKDYINNKLDGWSYDGKWIRKTFKTHSWKSTLMVVNSIGHLAEAAWHHPDLPISYAFVEVKLMNHAKKGITQLDFDLKIDDFIYGIQKTMNHHWRESSDPRFAYIKYEKSSE